VRLSRPTEGITMGEAICAACTSSGCGRHACRRLRKLLPAKWSSRELTMPSSSLAHIAENAVVSLPEILEATPFPYLPHLSARQNKLLEARYGDRNTYKRIAKRFKIKERTAKAQLLRMRRDLMSALSKGMNANSTGIGG
jgi:hypothetical protein